MRGSQLNMKDLRNSILIAFEAVIRLLSDFTVLLGFLTAHVRITPNNLLPVSERLHALPSSAGRTQFRVGGSIPPLAITCSV